MSAKAVPELYVPPSSVIPYSVEPESVRLP